MLFNKRSDTWLKITNMILIIIAVISLGSGIGCSIIKDSVQATDEIKQTLIMGYTIFGTSIFALFVLNMLKED